MGEYTYRYPLQRLLARAHIRFDFVGSQKKGLDHSFKWPLDFDPHHEGYYGATTAEVARHLSQHSAKLARPDIAIIHLGTNDKIATDQTINAPLNQIIAQLRQKNAAVKVILFLIPTEKNDLRNGLISATAMRLNRLTSPVSTIPLYQYWNSEQDTFDGAHPNASGQQKMAQLIYQQILAELAKPMNTNQKLLASRKTPKLR